MPKMTELMEPFHCFAQSNSSSASTLLCLFLHLNLFAFLFDITSEHSAELKWLMLNKHKRWFQFVTCEIFLGLHVCELVFGVDVLDLDFGVQVNSIEQPIKSNSVGPGNMSHCGTSFLYDHLDHCFVVFKHAQQSFLMRNRTLEETRSTLSKTLITPRDWWRT